MKNNDDQNDIEFQLRCSLVSLKVFKKYSIFICFCLIIIISVNFCLSILNNYSKRILKEYLLKIFFIPLFILISNLYNNKMQKELEKNKQINNFSWKFSFFIAIFLSFVNLGFFEFLYFKGTQFIINEENKSLIYYFSQYFSLIYLFFWMLIRLKKIKICLLIIHQIYRFLRIILSFNIAIENIFFTSFCEVFIFIISLEIYNLSEFYIKELNLSHEEKRNQDKNWKYLINSLPHGLCIIKEKFNEIIFMNKEFNKIIQHENLSDNISNCSLNINDLEKVFGEIINVKKNNRNQIRTKLSTLLLSLKENISQEIFQTKKKKFEIILNSENKNNKKEVDLSILSNCNFNNDKVFVLIIEDVTKKNLVKKLSENDKFKTRILSSFSHELRTPLNSSISLLKTLSKKKRSFMKEDFELIEISYNNMQILKNCCNDFVDYSHILTKQLVIDIKMFDIKKFITEIVKIYKLQAKVKKIEIEVVFRKLNHQYIFSDENRLSQILMNLISNAIKFTFDGFVKIIVESINESDIKFIVEDSGIGISKDRLMNLKNFLSSCSIDIDINSTGSCLGLLITENLIRYLKQETGTKKMSEINIESKGVNFGCRVSFTIENWKFEKKIYSENNEKNAYFKKEIIACENNIEEHNFPKIFKKISVKSKEILCKSKLILIVDDEPFNLLALELFFGKLEFDYIKAFDGKQAFEIFRENLCLDCKNNKCKGIKLIIMDFQMPVMDGAEATFKIKEFIENNDLNDIPIVGCTAFSGKDEVEKCLKVGMLEVFIKPITDSIIKRIINLI